MTSCADGTEAGRSREVGGDSDGSCLCLCGVMAMTREGMDREDVRERRAKRRGQKKEREKERKRGEKGKTQGQK